MEKILEKWDVIYIIFFLVWLIIFIQIIILFEPHEEELLKNSSIEEKNYSLNSEQQLIDECQNMSPTELAEHMTKAVSTIYKYKKVPDGLAYTTFEELKQRGGDCQSYSIFYVRVARELNYYAEIITIRSKPNERHIYARIWNHEGFCIIDALDYFCKEYS